MYLELGFNSSSVQSPSFVSAHLSLIRVQISFHLGSLDKRDQSSLRNPATWLLLEKVKSVVLASTTVEAMGARVKVAKWR